MKMMLSDFIEKLKIVSKEGNYPKTIGLIGMLKQNLEERGDIEIDVDHMCRHLGIKF